MKLKARIDSREYDLTIKYQGQKAVLTVNGRPSDLEVRELAPAEYLIIDGSQIYHCRVSIDSERHNSFAVHLRGRSQSVQILDPKRLRLGQSTGGHDRGAAKIVAPMPGKVVRILVEPGAQVEAGAGLVVVEAMKMQNEMKTPKSGIVISLPAQTGATVNAGDVLAVIE